MTDYLVYRGQHCTADQIHSRLSSICFSTRKVAETYALKPNEAEDVPLDPKVLTAKISINNPFIDQPGDCYLDVDDLVVLLPGFSKEDISVPLCEQCEYPTYQVWRLLDCTEFIDLLTAHGFDGAIYQGSGSGACAPEYRVFHPEQIQLLGVERIFNSRHDYTNKD